MNLQTLLEKSARDHSHLCPRQILGVRLGLLGMKVLGFHEPPAKNVKRPLKPQARKSRPLRRPHCGADSSRYCQRSANGPSARAPAVQTSP